MEKRGTVAVFAVAVMCGACVKVKPVVLDRRMQLENQVLGELRQLSRRLIVHSSVRGGRGDAPMPRPSRSGLDPLRVEIVEAMMNRAFNADDIELLRRSGEVGEGQDGLLRLFERGGKDRRRRAWVAALVREENVDRERILKGIVASSPDLGSDDLPLVRSIFYRLQARTAPAGTLVETRPNHFERRGPSQRAKVDAP